ncbi:hypothetical protein [Streptomyces sp. TP-A0874]|uniref:hypothetical protein n=1 Tax=Streptomyces sp. TP-A0874 TaxID=549819 RepID=UPI0008538BDF|nr:hypothetical protein [Streptomyces sp. TP-A0874]
MTTGEQRPQERPPGPSVRRRWFTLLIVVLLIGIPAGYIVLSGAQSRQSGREKQARAAATGLTDGWPSQVARRIYDVPIEHYSADVAFYETNSWKTSKMYVQFVTSEDGLNRFLRNIGTDREALTEGKVTISEQEAATVDWGLGPGRPSASSRAASPAPTTAADWAGTTVTQPRPEPELDVTVDLSNRAHPMIYVVSTIVP